MNSLAKRQQIAGILFCSPWMFGMACFMAFPVLAAFWYSLCNYSVLLPPVFVGADNYVELSQDPLFWQSLWNTTFFALASVVLGMLVSLGLALLLNNRVKGIGLYRTLFFLPTLMPVVATSVLWLWMYKGDGGVINEMLAWIGIAGPNWLQDPMTAKWAMVLMSVWGAGNAMVILLAGLQDVPENLHEAAHMDGANWWQRLIHITIPMLSPVLYFNLIMGVIGGFQVFTQAFIMTDSTGAPERSTLFYVLHLYNLAFQDLRMGYACAMAIILFLIILGLTLVLHRISQRFVHYER